MQFDILWRCLLKYPSKFHNVIAVWAGQFNPHSGILDETFSKHSLKITFFKEWLLLPAGGIGLGLGFRYQYSLQNMKKWNK